MIEGISPRQADLFSSAAATRAATLDLDEALANARHALATAVDAGVRDSKNIGGFRDMKAHLPASPGGPEIYALCPGCKVHPDGGIFPAAELARAEGCPTGTRMPAEESDLAGGEKRRRAEREGSAHTDSERRNTLSRFSSSDFFSLTELKGLCSGLFGSMAHLAPRRLLAESGRRLRRRWYFHRRHAICRQRLSRIVSDPSSTF